MLCVCGIYLPGGGVAAEVGKGGREPAVNLVKSELHVIGVHDRLRTHRHTNQIQTHTCTYAKTHIHKCTHTHTHTHTHTIRHFRLVLIQAAINLNLIG